MTARYRRPRPAPTVPAGYLPASCCQCGYDGAWDPERGVVVHAWLPPCSVRVPEVAEPDEHEEAA